uniref:Ig-like domain-containing protein n=1 Tax=Pygocentrus nattereri TaxID=42514 RepID=A0AAR2J9B9_PYGNA
MTSVNRHFISPTEPLSGLFITQTPTLLIKELGESVKVGCEHNDSTYYYIYWYRQRSLGAMDLIATSVGKGSVQIVLPFNESKYSMTRPDVKRSVLQIEKLESEDSAVYFCSSSTSYSNAEFGKGTKLTVLEPNTTISRPTVNLLPPSSGELYNDMKKVTLVCLADRFYPDHITFAWQKNGINIKDGVATDHSALQDPQTKFYTISSRLSVDKTDWEDPKNNFTCTVSFYDGTKYHSHPYTLKKPKAGVRASILTTVRFGYFLLLSKSLVYALFVAMLVWKCKPTKEMSVLRET